MSAAMQDARVVLQDLRTWASQQAYPTWWRLGVDRRHGGFYETIAQDGSPQPAPRRARVQPRQIFAFAVGGRLGWDGPGPEAVQHGLDFFLGRYSRPDGLFRTLVSATGEPLDETVVVYDQAFAVFGLCQAFLALGRPAWLRERAESVRDTLIASLAHPMGGFEEWPKSNPRKLPLISNPHMHLFEASLAWTEAGGDKVWKSLADEIGELALSRFIDPVTGGVREFFAGDWTPAPGTSGRILEPGHQFEWGWLLLRWGSAYNRPQAIPAALRMIELGNGPGLDSIRGVAVNQILDDFSVHDGQARLWPQTERIKAAAMAARLSEEDRWWSVAANAGRSLMRYFDTPVSGLWWDKLTPEGQFIEEPAPASSFYHIVCAILELEEALRSKL